MAVQHRELPLYGVQFHPESVLTEGGHRLLANWLEVCGDDEAVAPVRRAGPARAALKPRRAEPPRPTDRAPPRAPA